MSAAPPTWTDWTLTNPAVGNEWRQKANGAECLSFPIWLYCDDTSGNTSKRWNAHNSFLFTAAGLPRSEASKEYNVHFLATSNSAPTLEMLDGIADQLHDCQENGIWAWDSKTQSHVLLLVCVLALLGDNPMQSEFACHISLRGKFFCRTCWVKGKDAKAENVAVPEERDTSSGDDESDTQSVDSASTSASKGGKRKKRKVFKESLQSMYNRVKSFVKPGKPRTKDETIAALKSQFVHAESVGTAKKLEEMRTASGIKDTYQMFFINCLLERRQNQSNELHSVSQNLMSPVWRIRGLDPHSDTPVEILHVVLLGFVKYLWRDVIDNQLKKNADKKKELATRLSSLDISGLGIESKLAGNTLPEIKSLDSYIALLQHEIEQFLLYAAKWSIRWFNKPKFHILVHLPDHIRHFGPAILFETEVFESYNAVISAKSIHSNRLAPSRDIAWAFAKQNQIRHMLSGGQFLDGEQIDLNPSSKAVEDTTLPQKDRLTRVQQYFRNGSVAPEHWVQVGQSALDVVSWSGVIKKSLGVVDHVVGGLPSTGMASAGFCLYVEYIAGSCVLDASSSSQKWVNTAVGRLAAETSLYSPQEKAECSFHRAKLFLATNGDKCSPLDFVACSAPAVNEFGIDRILVVRIKEALGCKRNIFPIKTVDCILVEAFHVSTVASGQGMPRLSPSRQVFAVPPAIEGNAPVQQEREKTSELKDIVVHKGVLEDWVLNTAQMRDTQYLQRFCISVTPLPLAYVLEKSTAHEWAAQNPRKHAQQPLQLPPVPVPYSQQLLPPSMERRNPLQATHLSSTAPSTISPPTPQIPHFSINQANSYAMPHNSTAFPSRLPQIRSRTPHPLPPISPQAPSCYLPPSSSHLPSQAPPQVPSQSSGQAPYYLPGSSLQMGSTQMTPPIFPVPSQVLYPPTVNSHRTPLSAPSLYSPELLNSHVVMDSMHAISVDIGVSRLLQDAYNLVEAPEMDSSDPSELEDTPETEAPEPHLPHLLPRHSPQLLPPQLTPLLYHARPPPPPPLFYLCSPPTPHTKAAAPSATTPHLILAFPSPEAADPLSGPPDVSSEVQGSRTSTGQCHFVSRKHGMESGSERDETPSAETCQGAETVAGLSGAESLSQRVATIPPTL
ncbi:hypothetical protein F5876DRAFT_82513 [Lentinula aff. lateritia]|uniref:Uncharacterized protein n=1 Tax=Lentinula aff. lateritia TaxID=2804960 RepID=A0ACC1TKD3_9AGAR|nr:hypothetical protein F5876DRAFT_82513 [Lentinula aff. lateritia]